jgi:hypothetical protein
LQLSKSHQSRSQTLVGVLTSKSWWDEDDDNAVSGVVGVLMGFFCVWRLDALEQQK